jgi:hypothetical protein
MRFQARRYARVSAALCLGIALLFTQAASAQQQAQTLEAAVPETAPPNTGSNRKKIIADFPIWKRITVGTHKGVNTMREALDAARIRIGNSADEILGRPAFPFSRTKRELDLVVLTAADLGFTGHAPLSAIYRSALQLGLQLCPAEVGPQLRLQYLDQRVGEFLHIAMQPIPTYHGDLVDLTVANGGAGLLLLGGDASPDLKLHSTIKFVFVRPPQVASRMPDDSGLPTRDELAASPHQNSIAPSD